MEGLYLKVKDAATQRAIQRLEQKVDALEQENKALKAELAALKK